MEKIVPYFGQHLNQNEFAASIINPQLRDGKDIILVGTNHGRCLVSTLNKLDKLRQIYEDPENRQIVAMGFWPFDEVPSTCRNNTIWFHFRSSAITLYHLLDSSNQIILSPPLRSLSTGHYGFCQALADPLHRRFFIPDYEDLNNLLRIHYANKGEKIIRFSAEFLTKNCIERETMGRDGQNQAMFKGMIMGIEILVNNDDCVLLAFEDSTVCVFNLCKKQVNDALKHPKHQEFLCWSSAMTETGQTLIAVSVIGQLYLLSHFADEKGIGIKQLKAECVLRKCKNDVNCSAIAISSISGGLNCEYRLAAGFKNGLIQVDSLFPTADDSNGMFPPRWSHQTLFVCSDFHTNSIQCLRWIHPFKKTDEKQKVDEINRPPNNPTSNSPSTSVMTFCSSGSDEKVAFFQLPPL